MGILNWPVSSRDEKYVVAENSLPMRDALRQWSQTWIVNWARELLELARCALARRNRNEAKLGARRMVAPDLDPCWARRMVALNLDPCELRLFDPALARHMQRQCTLCESREYCLQVLTSESSGSALRDGEDWRDYCPNALALDMLSALQSRSRTD
jgi:hypothetical protein